ncbi:MAG: pyruvate formate lyase family protein [Armatimonadota bacterium]
MAVLLEENALNTAGWTITPDEAAILESHGQFYTAGFMLGEDVSIPMRFAHAIDNHLSKCTLHEYSGGMLYPSTGMIWLPPDRPQILWNFYVELGRNPQVADQFIESSASDIERRTFRKARLCCDTYPRGGGFTHSIVNYGRVLSEGLDSYRTRIQGHLASANDQEKQELYEALLVVVDAIDRFRLRVADHLDNLSFTDSVSEHNRLRLADALRSGLPMRPANGLYEAMVSTSFIYAIDGPDNLGRFDQFMYPYFRDDIASGKITREEAVDLVKALWTYVDNCSAWNVALGGTTRDGREASTDLTHVCLEAAHTRRRPNLALRLREDTPDDIWNAAFDTIATGAGLPALYCEENYLKAMDMAQLNIPDEDKRDYAFGGCTELMVHGCSNVGSLEGDFHVIKVLENCLYNHLPECGTFEEFLTVFEQDIRAGIADNTAMMSRNQEARSKCDPLLIRTLLIDDCIDRGRNYSDGGARHNWSIVNIVGLSNAIDSLEAVRKSVYQDKRVTADELLTALKDNFLGHDDLHAYLRQCPRFGNDDPQVNQLANHLSGVVYKEFKRYAPWRGGKFLSGTLMFVTYGMYGEPVGATPDGRLAGTPVGDSAGPVQGRDKTGPTAMLHSTASLQQLHAPGTLVVNLRVSKSLISTSEGRSKLKSLIRTYFKMGGLQLQVNVVDQDLLRDAIEHPENHHDLIIRIGGYSEYFNYLTEDLKQSVLERTEHS